MAIRMTTQPTRPCGSGRPRSTILIATGAPVQRQEGAEGAGAEGEAAGEEASGPAGQPGASAEAQGERRYTVAPMKQNPEGGVEAAEEGEATEPAAAAGGGGSGGRAPVQGQGDVARDRSESVHDAAARGIGGSSGQLPHLSAIQASFGHHDVSSVHAHTDGAAAEACGQINAEAYATGSHVAFGSGAPSLHTAAHEAAHVVQCQTPTPAPPERRSRQSWCGGSPAGPRPT
jgi:hypothetical protein